MELEIKCPHCGGDIELDREEAATIDEDDLYEWECNECGKGVIVKHIILHSWEAQCKDGEHDLEPGKEINWLGRCKKCGEYDKMAD